MALDHLIFFAVIPLLAILIGFIFSLRYFLQWVKFLGKEAKGRHRVRDARERNFRILGIILMISGIIGEIILILVNRVNET